MAISNTLSQPDPTWTTIQNSGVLDNAPPLSTTPLDKLRAQQKAFGIKSHSTPTALTTRDTKIQVSDATKIDLRIYTPDEKNESLPIVVVYHGGGWVMGDLDTEDVFCRYLCVDGPAIVVNVDYRLAPEHPFPIPFNDCFDAYTWAVASASQLGGDVSKIIVAGSSAGGNLAASVALRARDAGHEALVGQILIHPATCVPSFYPSDKFLLESMKENKNAPVLTAEDMQYFWDLYVPGDKGKEVYASPLLASHFDGLPPAFIQIVGLDPLRDEGIAYATALKAAGVRTEMDVYAGIPHGFTLFPDLPAAQLGLKRAAKAIQWILQKKAIE